MTDDPYLFPQPQKKYRWSYQFGLYRYDSDDRGTRYRNILMKRSNIQYFAILAMFGIAILLICFLMYTSPSNIDTEDQLDETTLEEYPSILRKNIDGQHNLSDPNPINISISNVAAEKLIQSLPNLYLTPPSSTTSHPFRDDLDAVESNKNDDKFNPLYFDEYIPNLQPPPKMNQPNTQNRRNYMLPPNPFRFINSGPRPQAFQMHPQNVDRKFPQIYESYHYPQKAMNIQDIIKYLTNKRGRKLNRIAFAGKFQNINSDSSTQVNRNQNNDNGLLLTEEQVFNDPFYKFKPSDPSDINLLAPNQFRFAPSLLQNHRLVPANEDIPNTRIRKAKPVSLMLDIYPMPEENNDEVDKFGTRKPVFIRPMYNPSNHYNNLNSLYHLSNYPNQQPILIPKVQMHKVNKNQNLNIYDVTGYHYNNGNRYSPQLQQDTQSVENDLEKMIVHLNLHPRKKFHQHSELKNTKNLVNYEDNLFMESVIQNTTVPTANPAINNVTIGTSRINNRFSETMKNQMETSIEEGKLSENSNQFSQSKERQTQRNSASNEMDKNYSLEIQKTSQKMIPILTTTSENPKIFIFSPQIIEEQKNYYQNHSKTDINSKEQTPHIQFVENTTPGKSSSEYSIPLESGFYPIKFDNVSFSSEPLDKNFMANIQGHYAKKRITKEPNLETAFNSSEIIQYYEPLLINSDIDRSDNDYTNENEKAGDESNDVMNELLKNFEVNPNLKNHKPFFSVVNESLKHS